MVSFGVTEKEILCKILKFSHARTQMSEFEGTFPEKLNFLCSLTLTLDVVTPLA